MKPIWSTRRLVSAGAALVALAGIAGTAEAGRRAAHGYVVAESRHGNGTVSGPVRSTSLGPQVRMPGGTWIYCRMSCTETLRVETVDFWESRHRTGTDRAFGLLDYFFGYPY